MPSNYYGLLVVLLALYQDMAISSPIKSHAGRRCPPQSLPNWDVIKDNARKLYELSIKFYNQSQARELILDGIPRIKCENQCGPKELSLNKEICLRQIHYVLSYYKTYLDILSDDDLNQHEQEKDIVQIKKVIFDLLCNLKQYGNSDKTKRITPTNIPPAFVKTKFGTPLATSSTVIARVFAAGDPANHWPKEENPSF